MNSEEKMQSLQSQIEDVKEHIYETKRNHRNTIQWLEGTLKNRQTELLKLQYPGFLEEGYKELVKGEDFDRLQESHIRTRLKRLCGEELDRERLRKAVDYLRSKGAIDEDDLCYGVVKDCPITAKEFRNLFRQLEDMAGDRIHEIPSSFSMFTAYFEYDGFRFSWHLTVGQGSICDLRSTFDPVDNPFREDLKITIPV